MTKRRLLLAVALGLPGCDYFSEVTVPGTDTGPPAAIASVFSDGEYIEFDYRLGGGGGLAYLTHDADAWLVGIGAAYDVGGVRELSMWRQIRVSCPGVGLIDDEEIYVKTQTGGVGSTVSNGLWLGEPFNASSEFWRCGGGTPDVVQLKWRVWAEDFHGNVSTYGTSDTPAVIAWTPGG